MGIKQINPLFRIQEKTREMIIGNPYRFAAPLQYFTLSKYGTGADVAKLTINTSITQTLTIINGSAKFYTDSGGTTGESTTFNLTSGGDRIIYLKCSSDDSDVTINAEYITKMRWDSITDSPSITADLTLFSALTYLFLSGYCNITTSLPDSLKSFTVNTYRSKWSYNGALPSGLTNLAVYGDNINWTYNGALPSGLTYLKLQGSQIDWTGLSIGNAGNIATLNLIKFRKIKMSSADMVTLLTQMTNRSGSLPATITINDYADYASPPSSVTDAVSALKAAKSITTVNLGA